MHPLRTGLPVTEPSIAIVGFQPLLTFRHFPPSSHFAHMFYRAHTIAFSLSRVFILALDIVFALSCILAVTLSRSCIISLARFFPFLSRFLFFFFKLILLSWFLATNMSPLYFCLPHLTYFFSFYLSKCNRDLYKNVHLLRLIVIIFII